MKKFVGITFVVGLVISYAVSDAGPYRIFEAIGASAFLTFISWIVARYNSWRWGAATMAAFSGLMILGH